MPAYIGRHRAPTHHALDLLCAAVAVFLLAAVPLMFTTVALAIAYQTGAL